MPCLDPLEPVVGAVDLAVPEIPPGMFQRVLKLTGALCVQVSHTLEELAQAGQLHREVEPIEQMLRVRTQVALQLL
jgi:hypothetical protein